MSNNWKKVKENLCKKADAMKAKAADFPGYKCPLSRTQMRQGFHRSRCRRQYFGEDYLDAGWAWEPAQLLDFLQDPEIAILEADPEE
jgi:hypothetical protein